MKKAAIYKPIKSKIMKRKIIYHNFPIGMCEICWRDGVKVFCDSIMYYDEYSKWVEAKGNVTINDFQEYCKFVEKECSITLRKPQDAFSDGMQLYKKYYSEKAPFVGIEHEMMFDFYENKKTEFEIVCLMAFLALRSIIGHKKYARTNFDLMFARMSGHNSTKEAEVLPNVLQPYQKEYRRNKVINALKKDWHLSYYSAIGIRGFYVSFDMSYSDLCKIAESKRPSSIMKAIKEDEKKAKAKVLKELKENKSLLLKSDATQKKIQDFKNEVSRYCFDRRMYDTTAIESFIDEWTMPIGNDRLYFEGKTKTEIETALKILAP